MNTFGLYRRQRSAQRTGLLFLVLCCILVVLVGETLTLTQVVKPQPVFELELPDFQILPSSQTEITVPSSSVSRVFLHILKPAADSIDYGAIRTTINGQASGPISEVSAGARGKMVKMDLKLLPGFQFVAGRNTVEVWAQNRRGRMYYSSFIVKTINENWNEDFTYEVQQAPGAVKEVPPQVVLLEPVRRIELSPTVRNMTVRVSGTATASTTIARVLVDGNSIPFKAEQKTRQLVRIPNSERSIAFETTRRIDPNTTGIVVEAHDQSGSFTRVTIPVVNKKHGPATSVRQKYALIVGISKYKNNLRGIPNLDYADKDAHAIYEFLQRPAAGGFARENMLLLTNEDATLARIREALTNFIARASANDLLLIFFAGHGAPDPFAPQNLYMIAYDTSVENMPQTALAMPELRQFIEQKVESKRVVLMLDACHSAGLSTEVTRDLANNLANLYLEKLLYQEEGRAIITSSDVGEPSRESQKWGNGHGVFTYYVLEGLKGNADTNRDRFVSVGELFRYVRQKVRSDTEFKQNPRILTGANEDLALAVAHLR